MLSTIVAKAVQLSDTEAGAIYVFDDAQREFHLRATTAWTRSRLTRSRSGTSGLMSANVALAAQREPIQVADLQQEPSADYK